ncbi:MAG: FAD-binding protein, partial [Firmicutes bacterium]|nr:FAD-binding protein [Bacillota bacterium]
TCLEHGIDITKDDIPVGPVQHYMMGGVQTDLWGRTHVGGLYCCGEAACTGVHGANRLASNSTLECLVFGRRCAEAISGSAMQTPACGLELEDAHARSLAFDAEALIIELKGIMVKYCGIVRSGEQLRMGLNRVTEITDMLGSARLDSIRDMELYNMVTVAADILRGALKRRGSVGSHYRTDGEAQGND